MHREPDAELPAELAAALGQMRDRHLSTVPPEAGRALSAFFPVGLTNDHGDPSATTASNANKPALQAVELPNWRSRPTRERQPAMKPVAAFIGTTLGKIVLGTTVAAASVGTGHTLGVIDVPVLPDNGPSPTVEIDKDTDESTDHSEDDTGNDSSHDLSTGDTDESTDHSEDDTGNDSSHDWSDELCDFSFDESSDEDGSSDSSTDMSCDDDTDDDDTDDDDTDDDDTDDDDDSDDS